MGEGAGIVVLEEYEHAKKRGAKIYAEVVGYGLSGDAYHITSPAPDGDGGFRSMSAAIKRAGIAVSDIDYINAHGTSTQIGDEIELGAVERLLGNAASKVSMSSTKSSTGHLLGAAGAIEAIFSILAIRDNVAPPTINLENPSVETAIDLVPQTARLAIERADAYNLHAMVLQPQAPAIAARDTIEALDLFTRLQHDPVAAALPEFHQRFGDFLLNLAAFSEGTGNTDAGRHLSRAVDLYTDVAAAAIASGSRAQGELVASTLATVLPGLPEVHQQRLRPLYEQLQKIQTPEARR